MIKGMPAFLDTFKAEDFGENHRDLIGKVYVEKSATDSFWAKITVSPHLSSSLVIGVDVRVHDESTPNPVLVRQFQADEEFRGWYNHHAQILKEQLFTAQHDASNAIRSHFSGVK